MWFPIGVKVEGHFEAKEEAMTKYVNKEKELLVKLETRGIKYHIKEIPRKENQEADSLVKAASTNET